ncbi:MAG: proprotein convertase P-domain-containing protein, partial [Phycisphaeraceae bacterium]|nr:proprotein convertase P-domain-containing protein [Phycisphaeraceae bacterium]
MTGGGTYSGDGTNCLGLPQYTSDVAIPIQDNTTNSGTIEITDSGTISDFAVSVTMNHTFLADLHLSISNGVQSAFLTRDSGGGNDVNGTYIFSDQGSIALPAAGNLPPSGVYRASTTGSALVNLNAIFAGEPFAGTWTLTIFDDATADVGTISAWALIFNGGSPVCDDVTPPCPGDYNGDNVVDLADLLDFLGDWNPNLGQMGMGLPGDINGDNVVDLADLLEFLGDWNPNLGSTCP